MQNIISEIKLRDGTNIRTHMHAARIMDRVRIMDYIFCGLACLSSFRTVSISFLRVILSTMRSKFTNPSSFSLLLPCLTPKANSSVSSISADNA